MCSLRTFDSVPVATKHCFGGCFSVLRGAASELQGIASYGDWVLDSGRSAVRYGWTSWKSESKQPNRALWMLFPNWHFDGRGLRGPRSPLTRINQLGCVQLFVLPRLRPLLPRLFSSRHYRRAQLYCTMYAANLVTTSNDAANVWCITLLLDPQYQLML